MAEMKAEELSNCKCYLPCLVSSEVSGIVFSTFIYCSTKLETTEVFVFLKISIQLILVMLFCLVTTIMMKKVPKPQGIREITSLDRSKVTE